MATVRLKVARIGNSRGVRLLGDEIGSPGAGEAATLRRVLTEMYGE